MSWYYQFKWCKIYCQKKINIIENSKFKEQKGYKKRNIYVIGIDDEQIKLFSLFYDEVFIIVNTNKYNNCESFYNIYSSDPCIHIIKVTTYDDVQIDDSQDVFVVDDNNCKLTTHINHSYIKHKIH